MINEFCSYCETAMEADEELYPIYIGSLPQAKSITLSENVPKSTTGETVAYKNEVNDIQVLGYELGQLTAIINLLEGSEEIDFQTYEKVMEQQGFPEMSDGSIQRVKFESNKNKVAASIKIEPEMEEQEPDMMVCEACKKELEGIND